MHLAMFWIAVVLSALISWFAVPTFYRWRASKELSALAQAQRAIILTYDDGPSDFLTLRLADLLKRRKVQATFFVIGYHASRHPQTIQRMLEDGHEIGNHTYEHLNAWKTGPLRSIRDIRRGGRQLEHFGVESAIFRPPFGKSTLLTLSYSVMHNMKLAFWTHDSRDSWNRLSPTRVLEELGMTGGGVVLMHDFDRPRRGPSPEEHQEYVLELTEKIIDFAEANGFTVIPFRELFNKPKLDMIKGST